MAAKDLFVHYSEIKWTAMLPRRQQVSFEIGSGPKGPCATEVTPGLAPSILPFLWQKRVPHWERVFYFGHKTSRHDDTIR